MPCGIYLLYFLQSYKTYDAYFPKYTGCSPSFSPLPSLFLLQATFPGSPMTLPHVHLRCNSLFVPAYLHLVHLVWPKRLISTEPPAGFGQWEKAGKYHRVRGLESGLIISWAYAPLASCFYFSSSLPLTPLSFSLSLMLVMGSFFYKKPKLLAGGLLP